MVLEENKSKTDKVQDVLTFALESGGSVRHHTLTLGGSHSTTEVGLSGFAELAFFALYTMICQR